MDRAFFVNPTFCSNQIKIIRDLSVPSAPILNIIGYHNHQGGI